MGIPWRKSGIGWPAFWRKRIELLFGAEKSKGKKLNKINHHGPSVSLKFKKEEKWEKQRIFN
jgi:hypothetical protein